MTTFRMMLGDDQRGRILARARKAGWSPNGRGLWSKGAEVWCVEDVLLHFS